MRRGTAILVFARAPAPGRTKTRLAERIGASRAARLQAGLTLQAIRTALASRAGPVELHAAPARRHGFFRMAARRFSIPAADQAGADLGERMQRALARALRRHRAAILVGTDCPDLGPRDLRRAARLLRGACDAVLAPAEDGGYALIGLRTSRPALFEGIDWGKSSVYAQTVARLAAGALRWRALRAVWDVDRPEDLERLAAVRLALLTRTQVRSRAGTMARRR